MKNDAVKIIKSGGIIAFPTETVYGLGCDASNIAAVSKIYDLKKRDNKPLSIIVSDIEMAKKYAVFNDIELDIANKYWPGALTLVMDKKHPCDLAPNICDGDTVGIRVPNHSTALDLIKQFGVPLVATSVNISGQPAMTYDEIIANFKDDIDLIIPPNDKAESGKSSTVIRIQDGKIKILRQGDIFL